MDDPVWLREDLIRSVHRRQLAEHGGAEGVRDDGLLESALARPRNQWIYGDPPPDLAALAATYAAGLVQNHPFVDGNKRTAYVACRTFLLLNGEDLDAPREEKLQVFLDLAAGHVSEDDLAAWVRARLRRADQDAVPGT